MFCSQNKNKIQRLTKNFQILKLGCLIFLSKKIKLINKIRVKRQRLLLQDFQQERGQKEKEMT